MSALREFLREFFELFQSACPGHLALDELKSVIQRPFIKPAYAGHILADRPPKSWIVVPYSKSWSNARFGKLLKDHNSRWQSIFTARGEEPFTNIGVSWSLGGTHIAKSISAISSKERF